MASKTIKLLILLLSAAIPILTAEIPKQEETLKPELVTAPVETHAVFKKHTQESEHPVYRADQQGRANIEPVRPKAPVISHDPMLADQPHGASEVNRIDELTIPGYGFVPTPVEVYPDVPYAPGYNYDSGYAGSNSYELYDSPHNYLMEPDVSTFSLLWSQVPDARTFVSYIGRSVHWVFSSIFVILLGTFLTVAVCSYTNLCTIKFNGVGPIHEEMRALMSPERLEKISNAADFVKTAIDKYQKIQKVNESTSNLAGLRRRRSVFY